MTHAMQPRSLVKPIELTLDAEHAAERKQLPGADSSKALDMPCASTAACSEATPSDVASSHGGVTPRMQARASDAASTTQACSERWADIMEASVQDTSRAWHWWQQNEQGDGSFFPSSPSRSARRRNRRKRQAADGWAKAWPEPGPLPAVDMSVPEGGTVSGRQRSVVTLDDLGLNLNTSQTPAKETAQGGAWSLPATPCKVRAGPAGIMGTTPTAAGSPLAFSLAETFDASSRVPCAASCDGPVRPGLLSMPSPCRSLSGRNYANFPDALCDEGHYAHAETGLASPAAHEALATPTHVALRGAGDASALLTILPQGGSGIAASPTHSSCMTPAASPTSQSIGEVCLPSPAGSPAADALRSWLGASGLPTCGDITAQLLAAAPEVYED
eukprot:TRINITY_DN40794_c0_g1_i2.p1 TRINITY_DN40794_c0_g1~~TRINITY_DN40794_c0_g1_i2.p1  ORF type:complete len:388 (+),score=71.31 TRINITY_DN40794_c0_g1_i2:106-1269(+)